MKKRCHYSLIAVLLSLSPLLYAASSPNEKSAIGINLSELNYWSTQWTLIDVMKHAANGSGGLWSTYNADTYTASTEYLERLDLDEQGWPQSLPERDDPDFHYVHTIIYQDNTHYPVGEYTILYDGEGELSYNGVTYLDDKSAPGRHIVQLDAGAHFHLQIRKTDPNNTGNYLRNIRILVPGGICGTRPTAYAATADECETPSSFARFEQIYHNQSFHPLFLQDLSQYRALRFMGMLATIASEQRVWSDRPLPANVSWAIENGVPLEMAIDLANKTQAEPWLNMPVRVDDDYMQQYAQLVKDQLDENLTVRIELGNEIWNDAYPYIIDANWMEARGRETWPNAGADAFDYRLNYFGKRTAQMCQIWKATFADQAGRVNCVMGGFVANVWVNRRILDCPLWASEREGRKCAEDVDSLAIGPYFGGYVNNDRYLPLWTDWLTEDPALAIDRLFAEINQGILRDLSYDPELPDWAQAPEGGALTQTQGFIDENITLANEYGLELSAYEGGQHLTFAGDMRDERAIINGQVLLAGNRDARMGTAFSQHFDDWRTAGGTLYMVFQSTGRWGSFGAFPLKEYQQQPMAETPKLAATLQYISDYPCWWEGCDRTTLAYDYVELMPAPEPEPEPDPENDPIELGVTARAETRGLALTWLALNIPVHFYQIFRDEQFVGHVDGGTLTYNDDWLALGVLYAFQIKAVDTAGAVISTSNSVHTMAGDSEPSTAPSNLAVSFDGNYGFNLTWTASSDNSSVARYSIYRNGEVIASTEQTVFADNWPPGESATYQVIAYDLYDNASPPSASIVGTLPARSITLAAQARPETWGIALTWSEVQSDPANPVTAYQISRNGVIVSHTSATMTAANQDWLTLHTQYRFVVTALNAGGEVLAVSNEVRLTAGDSETPSQPQGLQVAFNGAYGFNVSWSASSDNTGVAYYKIHRNGQAYTHREGLLLEDEWPPQGAVSYQIIAYDHYHNASLPSDIIFGERPQ